MREVETYNHWEVMPIRKGYRLLLDMGMDKRKAKWEALKGVRIFVISCKK
jgi:hypothetical protein